MNEPSEEIVAEIKRRALDFCCDNHRLGIDLLVIETAMLIGASVVIEKVPPPAIG